MNKLIAFFSLVIMIMATSCKTASSGEASADPNVTTSVAVSMPFRDSKPVDPAPGITRPVNAIPKATAFRMSGDYADHVAISIDNNGTITYFPAPTDISVNSAPISLAEGWWLNRQGIGINSVFTKYTFAEYAALPAVPSIEQLKEAIIPGARVTQITTLPFTIGEAEKNIPAINEFLQKNSL